ncbi:MAG: NrdH-redoxin [Candidatus Colwellbacteria bacterium CG10_big_fil_rev_8_21_14_0_10_42_22]|uniref:NrdH-redoxin n=1 Tax=Candidatus Colwellbacteria bacterium CG10_big_fil_rev_8_21_14_0_10_42_22 TaxID=1974540 RepID=A0A2H0VFE5_9BACT|nr:MAG: NrdH-redoxin [Candidatus Colwellbacteria bacterium CG10_big_fil_rev_8_21_14_0_10_42_22]
MEKPIIYTTPTCVYCKMVKGYFREKDVEFEEKDVVSDEVAREEMVEKSGQMGVPVTVIGEHVVIGFDKGTLDMLLEEKQEK